MTQGNPRLATWASDVLRVYELSGAGFVQVFSAGVPQDSAVALLDLYPQMEFINDDQHLLVRSSSSTTTGNFRTYSLGGSLISSINRPSGGGGRGISVSGAAKKFGMTISARADFPNSLPNGTTLFSPLGVLTGGSDRISSSNSGLGSNFLAFSPSNDLLVVGQNANASFIVPRSEGVMADGRPNFTMPNAKTIPHEYAMNRGLWSRDGRFFYSLDREGDVHIFERAGDDLSYGAPISSGLDTPHEMALARDGRILAISYNNSGTFKTKIFRRTGLTHMLIGEIAGFGGLLDFSGDGSLLIDARTRRAFENVDGVMTERVGILAALPAGVLSQAVSDHMLADVGDTFIYNDVLHEILNEQVDLDDLAIALLSAEADFNSAHTSFADVQAYEVSGFNWPDGGVPLGEASRLPVGSSGSMITYDQVERVIIEGSLEYRSIAIYEIGTSRLLAMVDFGKTVVAHENKRLVISPAETGIFNFVS